MLEGVYGAGTLGAFVRAYDDEEPLHILSNSHVIADNGNAPLGSSILQPGQLDGGTAAHRVAALSKFEPIDFTNGSANRIDAAIARIEDGVHAKTGVAPPYGNVKGVGDLIVRMADEEEVFVNKMGRTTGATRGTFSAFDIDVTVDYGGGRLAKFSNQLEFKSAAPGQTFSDAGDSGSVILDEDRYAVGLLFAGNPNGGLDGNGITYANPMNTVLDLLHVRLVI
jgi:hypothetical protein